MPIISKKRGTALSPNATTGAISQLKSWLVAYYGWTVSKSGDGSNYSATGDVNNFPTGAWLVLKHASGRELMFQSGGSYTTSLTVKYSRGGLFTGGNASTPPSASDSKTLYNDHRLAPNGGETSYITGDSATGAFCFFGFDNNSGGFAIFADFCKASTYSTGDTDPAVFYISSKDDVPAMSYGSLIAAGADYNPRTVLHGTLANAPMLVFAKADGTVLVPGGMNSSADGEQHWPVYYMVPSAGVRGQSSLFMWMGQAQSDGTLSSAMDYYFTASGKLALVWDGSTAL